MSGDISNVINLVLVIIAVVLIIIVVGMIYIINTQRKIMQRIESSDKKQAIENAASAYNRPEEDLDSELVAVIAASVAYVMGRPVSEINVKSIRRAGSAAPSWTLAGRQGQMDSRL